MCAALVDVDGTLCAKPSTEARFLRHLLGSGVVGAVQLAAAGWFLLRYASRYGRFVTQKNKAYLCGLSVQAVADLAQAFVATELAARLRPAVLARIAAHRERGEAIILLTGTPDFLAAPIAGLIGTPYWIAARCAQRNGRYLAAPPVFHPFGIDKLRCAEAWCAANGVRLQECTAYADAHTDLALLQHVGRPVAVYPDGRLARAAERHGWEVLSAAHAECPAACAVEPKP